MVLSDTLGKAASPGAWAPPLLGWHLFLPGLLSEDSSTQDPEPSQVARQIPLFISLTSPPPASEHHWLPRPSLSVLPSPCTPAIWMMACISWCLFLLPPLPLPTPSLVPAVHPPGRHSATSPEQLTPPQSKLFPDVSVHPQHFIHPHL